MTDLNVDVRDIAIINSLPLLYSENTIFTVGCGEGRLERALQTVGFEVTATDIWPERDIGVPYHIFDIMKDSLQISYGSVICSQVLEHLEDWKTAAKNLIPLANDRIIITVPWANSFYSDEHVNFWGDNEPKMSSIEEYKDIFTPYSVAISKIITKEKDVEYGQRNYLIVVDKHQKG